MKKISTGDIHNRITRLTEFYSNPNLQNINPELIFNEALKGENSAAVTKSIKYCANQITSSAINEQKEFEKILDIYDAALESDSINIEPVTRLIIEASDRVRKADELQTLLRRRLTKATRQNGANKIEKKLDDATTALSNTAKPITKPVEDLQTKIDSVKSANKTSGAASKSESADVFYNELCDHLSINAKIDKILSNYSKLSKRFNVDRVFMSIKDSIVDDIDIYCELFETWSEKEMSTKSKFNVAIETALFLNNKLHIDEDRSAIIEAITDYFIFRENENTDPIALYDRLYSYLETNFMVTDKELEPFTERYNEIHNIKPDNYGTVNYIVEQSKKDSKCDNKEIEKFKAMAKKSPTKLKELVSKIYMQQPEHIFKEIPNVFTLLRYFVVIGSFALNPILGVVTFMTDQFLKLELSRPMAAKMVEKYDKEIDKVEEKIKKTTDENKKKKLNEYLKTVKANYEKLKEHEDSLYTDEQNEKREEERWAKKAEKDNSDDDWDFGSLDEAVAMLSVVESVIDRPSDKFYSQISNNIKCLVENDMIDTITSFAIENSEMISRSKLISIYEDEIYTLRRGRKTPTDYVSISNLSKNIKRLYEESASDNIDSINKIMALNELFEALDILDAEKNTPFVLEVSFANTVNIVKTKIQSAFNKMSDKEKELSKNIDVTFVGFTKKVENMFNSNNREAVIKGSVIPSASKMLKMALAAGLTSWLIHPVVAVIGILGYIGVSKVIQNKERQLILDEIDTELQMVDKYLQQAEAKDDMKAYKNLLTTKKRLQREYTRIKYKIKMTTGKSPDVEKTVNPRGNNDY